MEGKKNDVRGVSIIKKRSSKYNCVLMVILLLLTLTACQKPLHDLGLGSINKTNSEKKTTLTIELFDRNNKPIGAPPITDNFMTQYIQDSFGDPNNIKVKFVTVQRSEELERLNVLMASNQAPDIVFTYNLPTVYKFAEQDKLTEMSSLLDQYGQNLVQILGDDVLSVGQFNDGQYAIPAKRVFRAHSSTFIREDWLQQLNLPLPETTEQFYNTLKAFKDMQPGNAGEDIIPYGHISVYHTSALQYSFWDWDQITDEDLFVNPRWVMPGNKDAFKFLNRLYNEGLIDSNFHLDRFSQQFQKDVVNGNIGAGTPNTNEPVYMGYMADLIKKEPQAKLTPIDPFKNKDGKTYKPILEVAGMYIMIPKTSKNAVAAIKYLNWMAQPENYMTLQHGVEGLTYHLEDGVPILNDNEESTRILYNFYDYCIILNGKYVSDTDLLKNIKANILVPDFEEFTQKSIEYAMRDGVEIPRINTILEAEVKYSGLLNDKEEEIFVKIVTATTEAFDSVYDQEVEDYMRTGGRAVMEERRIAYREQKGMN